MIKTLLPRVGLPGFPFLKLTISSISEIEMKQVFILKDSSLLLHPGSKPGMIAPQSYRYF